MIIWNYLLHVKLNESFTHPMLSVYQDCHTKGGLSSYKLCLTHHFFSKWPLCSKSGCFFQLFHWFGMFCFVRFYGLSHSGIAKEFGIFIILFDMKQFLVRNKRNSNGRMILCSNVFFKIKDKTKERKVTCEIKK